MKLGMLALAAIAAAGLFFVLYVAIKSYRDETSDFRRAPVPLISSQPEVTGIPDLAEVRFGGPAVPLAGWYAPSRNRAAIVLAHGTGADRSSLLAETRMLAATGFGVLALDFPGQGASGGRTYWGRGERAALVAAVDWLSRRPEVDSTRIGGFGLSIGGYILLQAAVAETRLRAIVLVSTPADIVEEVRLASNRWGLLSELPAVWALRRSGMPVDELRPPEVIASISPRAVFLLGGERDNWVPPASVRELFAVARDPRQLWIVPGGGHADFARAAPQEYAEQLNRFFAEHLLR
jgi:dipeptidyl aminopeptidase/acylaminoacyl peptidase